MRHPGTKIFLLEDNPLYQTLLVKQLEDTSPEIQVFGSGEAFLSAMETTVPDVVILDYNLEGIMTGYDVLRELKKLDSPPPVIFFSANLEIPVTSLILKLGVVQYIEKNIFTFSRLKQCIDRVLESRNQQIGYMINA